jgi:hypothetical protein
MGGVMLMLHIIINWGPHPDKSITHPNLTIHVSEIHHPFKIPTKPQPIALKASPTRRLKQ